MTLHFCTLCERLFDSRDLEKMKLLQDFPRRRGIGKVATYLDGVVVHTVLTEQASAKYLPKPEPEPTFQIQPKAGEQPPPAPSIPEDPPATQGEEILPETDDEAAALFEQAVVEQEEWTPLPDEWFQATVVLVGETKRGSFAHAIAQLSNGDEVFIRAGVVQRQVGYHQCLKEGDELSVRIEKNERSSKWKAIEVYLQTPRPELEEESGVVLKWHDNPATSGFVARDCGCDIYVKSLDENFFIKPGDRVAFTTRLQRDGRYVGHNTTLFEEEEQFQEEV